MIKTLEGISLFERVEDFYFVIDWESESNFNQIQELVSNRLAEKRCNYVLIGDEELKEKMTSRNRVIVVTKKSLNLLGKWKQPETIGFLGDRNEKVVVYFCTETNKLVNKLINSFQQATSVSYMNEKNTKFDISFRVDIGNERELLDQSIKYLKHL